MSDENYCDDPEELAEQRSHDDRYAEIDRLEAALAHAEGERDAAMHANSAADDEVADLSAALAAAERERDRLKADEVEWSKLVIESRDRADIEAGKALELIHDLNVANHRADKAERERDLHKEKCDILSGAMCDEDDALARMIGPRREGGASMSELERTIEEMRRQYREDGPQTYRAREVGLILEEIDRLRFAVATAERERDEARAEIEHLKSDLCVERLATQDAIDAADDKPGWYP